MCVCALAACSKNQSDSAGKPAANQPVDVAKVFAVKSNFGPEYRVATKGPTDIDPKTLAPPKLPPNMTFDPPECADLATGQRLPPGLKGTAASVLAQGNGTRFTVIAAQNIDHVPEAALPQNCQHVAFTTENASGTVDVVDAPQIQDAQTSATHRQFEVTVKGKERTGELYYYVAYLKNFVVTVSANSVTAAGQAPVPADTEQARSLLTAAVSAVRG